MDIKIEWDTTGGITSARFYRGWRLDEVFDYTRANNGTYTDGTTHTVYGTVSQSVPYVTDTVMIRHGNQNWNWSFHTANSSDTFGYNNKGFLFDQGNAIMDEQSSKIRFTFPFTFFCA